MAAESDRLNLPDRLALRPAEAAETLGISERKFRSLLPRLPHIREGGVVLIPVDLLRQWLVEQAAEDRSDSVVEEMLSELGVE